jgi:competence protein ComEA
MPGLTETERRGARVLAVLLVLGTLTDLYRARHPEWAPAPQAPEASTERSGAAAPPGSNTTTVEVPGGSGVDLNRASAAELDRLPGIGPVLAARIVLHRSQHGPFHSVGELLAVPGIGPRLLERLRPWVRQPAP